MNRRMLFVAAAAIGLMAPEVFAAPRAGGPAASPGAPATAPSQPAKRPDLTVAMEPVTIHYQNSDGTQCIMFRPGTITVRNAGTAVAAGFKVILEWNYGGGPLGLFGNVGGNQTLGPGATKVFVRDGPATSMIWCPGRGQYYPAWKVVVDPDNEVVESNETNNTVERRYRLGPSLQGAKPVTAPATR